MKKLIFVFVLTLFLSGCVFNQKSNSDISYDDPQALELKEALMLHEEGKYKKAFMRFEEKAKAGNILAMYQVGVYYRDGLHVSKDLLRAMFWFKTAGRYGNTKALRSVGYMYEYGLGVNQNFKKAKAYYYEASNLGSALADYDLGLLYLKTNEQNDAKIFLNRACAGGINEACEKFKELKF
ncbi:SEL1-like repeat protein [Campylobacter sp. RM9344]|uniref:Type IV secretion system putative lipoprotein virB7 n=1 Tax=Campylobacter californiensis TaxID=1032243 RepID=A0AAW3ZXP8_9BACT|nr:MULTISPECIES: tetratricopeptide repeat protein [unclassified Campylobacter]MBE2984005.1 SEL1-like repeat protein [Campylobacter sp. RM6883]MBE2986167.1 SEL1-like repeat protein [Campylobacter sp. RM12919]MBE2987579.1 SEL1-like repeat protein [Campylobacter sp. RM12920]MBE2994543.1 SEL1-like repeat protein [Campylobacter sp. RM6913]MBE3022537.1 SEL1-like repeat protein [Campylobacter sp. 7477a]MBE3030072.1 SEL1-like repeat protein [Campylobacter sp. RM9344]